MAISIATIDEELARKLVFCMWNLWPSLTRYIRRNRALDIQHDSTELKIAANPPNMILIHLSAFIASRRIFNSFLRLLFLVATDGVGQCCLVELHWFTLLWPHI